MTCANRSESRGGSGSSRSCSCGGACLSSSLRFVFSDGHVEMKWGTSSSCAPQSLQDGSPRAESADVGLKALTAKKKADPEVGSSG